MTTLCFHEAADTASLLREAAAWRLLGLLLECPAPGWHDQLAELAREADDPVLIAASDAARQEASEGLYHSTFGPGGPAAPREVSYRRGVLPGAALAELRSAYDAFAYRPSMDEPPDHVAVEVGFVAYVLLKAAFARTRGSDEQARLCIETGQSFIREHLARLAGRLADSLSASGIVYLAHAGEALRSRVGPAPADVALEVLQDDELSEEA